MYSAIIVEPREHPALEFVLDNFLQNLSNEWNFIIFHGKNNLSFINNIIDTKLSNHSHRITKYNLQVDNLNIHEYCNLFMKQTVLYDNIPTETFLVFQTDTMISSKYKHFINDFLHYDFVGAPIYNSYISHMNLGNGDASVVGNGGLSLRKKSKMLEIMNQEPYRYIPEDIFFSCPQTVSIYKPTLVDASRFSIESISNSECFGCHKPWEYCNDMYILSQIFHGIYQLYELNTGSKLKLYNSQNRKLNIAVIYTGKIYNYKQHFEFMQNTSITNHNTDCILVLGKEYNEHIIDFITNSIYDKTTVKTIPYNELPNNNNNMENYIESMNKIYKQKSIEYLNKDIDYDLVIYTHTDINIDQTIEFNQLASYIHSHNKLCYTEGHRIIISTPEHMSNYMITDLDNINKADCKIMDISHDIIPIINEKYNVLLGFNGLSEICDSYYYTEPIGDNTSSYEFDKMQDYDTIYMSNLLLKKHYNQLRSIIKRPFILVSGSGDCECPNELFENTEYFNEFINWTYLQHWFCQNCLITHPKITLIPLGLDYHTMMYYTHIRADRGPKTTPFNQEKQIMDLQADINPFWDRIPICYGSFHHLTNTKYGQDRIDAINHIPGKLIYYDSKLERHQIFKNQTSFAFVVSPFGQDYDCIRTWEALCLGCIVIIKNSPLNSLYEDLPVLIVNYWSEITEELLYSTIQLFKQKYLNNEFVYDKLYKHYWAYKLEEIKTICKNNKKVLKN